MSAVKSDFLARIRDCKHAWHEYPDAGHVERFICQECRAEVLCVVFMNESPTAKLSRVLSIIDANHEFASTLSEKADLAVLKANGIEERPE
jgi:hypothetical protein